MSGREPVLARLTPAKVLVLYCKPNQQHAHELYAHLRTAGWRGIQPILAHLPQRPPVSSDDLPPWGEIDATDREQLCAALTGAQAIIPMISIDFLNALLRVSPWLPAELLNVTPEHNPSATPGVRVVSLIVGYCHLAYIPHLMKLEVFNTRPLEAIKRVRRQRILRDLTHQIVTAHWPDDAEDDAGADAGDDARTDAGTVGT